MWRYRRRRRRGGGDYAYLLTNYIRYIYKQNIQECQPLIGPFLHVSGTASVQHIRLPLFQNNAITKCSEKTKHYQSIPLSFLFFSFHYYQCFFCSLFILEFYSILFQLLLSSFLFTYSFIYFFVFCFCFVCFCFVCFCFVFVCLRIKSPSVSGD